MTLQGSFETIKNTYRNGGMYVKIIFYNILVFLVLAIGMMVARIAEFDIQPIYVYLFALNSSIGNFISQPWGLITSLFTHFDFFHLAFNMLVFYFAGRMYEHFFGAKKLWALYILGGLFGNVLELIAHGLMPTIFPTDSYILGASGSILAVFTAVAIYRPNLPVKLFGLFEVKIIFLALAYLIYDFLQLGINDGTAHFAHIGGIVFGYLSVVRPSIMNSFMRFWEKIRSFSLKRKAKPVIIKGGKKFTDEEHNVYKKERQVKIDSILDKISKSGYESLTTEEKNFLFIESNQK